MNEKGSHGLTFKTLDLHIHTPASTDYKEKSVSASDIVAAAIAKGLDGICITDHNSFKWVDKITKAAKGKPLTVFPGIEISVTGGKKGPVHIIGIFEPGRTAEDLNDILSPIGLTLAKRGRTDEIAKGDPDQIIDAIAGHGGLPILAHADSSHGVLHDMKGQPRTRVIQNPRLAAAEVSKEKYRGVLDGTDPTYKRELPTYEASDAHSPSEMGVKLSYFKTQDLSLESLKQCFYDHQIRIRRQDEYKEFQAPQILSVSVTQGFFDGQEVHFHADQSTLIGGQGVGKSLLVEFIRFTLDQMSTIPDIILDVENKLKGQLGEGGQIKVVIQQATGPAYEVTRTYNGVSNPLEVVNLDTGDPYEGDIRSLFPIMAYSQTEGVDIARNPRAQLQLIDRFIAAASFQREVHATLEKLSKNDQKLAKVHDAKDRLASLEKDIESLAEEIKNIEDVLGQPVFTEMKNADEQRAAFKAELTYHDSLDSAVAEFIDDLSLSNPPISIGSNLGKNDSLQTANKLSRAALKALRSDLEASITNVQESKKKAQKLFDGWMPQYREIETRYKVFLSEAGGDQKRLEARRRQLETNKADLGEEVRSLRNRSRRLTQIISSRNELLDQLDKLMDKFFEARKQKYADLTDLSDGKLLLEISRAANTEDFAAALQQIATGTRIRKKDLTQIAKKVSPRDFIDLVLNNDTHKLAQQGSISQDAADKLISWLKALEAQEEVLALQYQYVPEDVPSIRYRKDDDKYHDLADLSTGQKCTALLIIALSSGNSPIIMDQPEEAIDIAFIFSDIVSKLRSGKEQRQFIITTHNPNIAVTAGSDLIHVLKSSATQGRIDRSGAIDDPQIRGEVIQHVEGGTTPYLIRGRIYGLLDTDKEDPD